MTVAPRVYAFWRLHLFTSIDKEVRLFHFYLLNIWLALSACGYNLQFLAYYRGWAIQVSLPQISRQYLIPVSLWIFSLYFFLMLILRIPVHILDAHPCCLIVQKIPLRLWGIFLGGHLLESKKSDKGTKKHTTNFWKIGGVEMGNNQSYWGQRERLRIQKFWSRRQRLCPTLMRLRGCLEGPGGFFGFLFCGLRQAYCHETKNEARIHDSIVTFFSKHLTPITCQAVYQVASVIHTLCHVWRWQTLNLTIVRGICLYRGTCKTMWQEPL